MSATAPKGRRVGRAVAITEPLRLPAHRGHGPLLRHGGCITVPAAHFAAKPMPDQRELPLSFPELAPDAPLLPVRMVNEFVYCPRLAYLMWVQEEWADSADTVEGRLKHRHVDAKADVLPEHPAEEEHMGVRRQRPFPLSHRERAGVRERRLRIRRGKGPSRIATHPTTPPTTSCATSRKTPATPCAPVPWKNSSA